MYSSFFERQTHCLKARKLFLSILQIWEINWMNIILANTWVSVSATWVFLLSVMKSHLNEY